MVVLGGRRSVLLVACVLLAAPVALAVGYFAPIEWTPGVNTGYFPEDTLDAVASCPGGIAAGFGVRDIVPGDPDGAGGWILWEEPYEDANGNGRYDPPQPESGVLQGESFTDLNLNGKWDGPWMAGYGRDADYWSATGVRDPVWARAIVLACGDTRVGLVSADVVGLFQDQVHAIRDAADAAGLNLDHLVVASTHTHDSFDTMGLWGQNIVTDGKSPRAMAHIRDQAIAALADAIDDLTTTTVTAGLTPTFREDIVGAAGYIQTDLRDPFVVDDALWALAFTDDATGANKGTLVNWSPHPETMAGTESLISSDYPHGLRTAVESAGATVGGRTHDPLGGTAVFFSGAVGGMMTTLGARVYGEDGQQVQGYGPRMDRIGEVAGWAALDAIANGDERVVDGVRVQVREVTFPMDNPFLAALNTIGVLDHPVGVGPTTVGPLPDGSVGVVPPVPMIRTEVNVITLTAGGSDFVQFVTYPGELLPEVHVGGLLGHHHPGHDDGVQFSPDLCYAYDPLKSAVNAGRQRNYNPTAPGADPADPDTWPKHDGWKRTVAAHSDIPHEPIIKDKMTAPYRLALGLANDQLGYIVPASDFIQATATGPYGEGQDRCNDDDHYEETVSAGSLMAPVIANNLAQMLDPDFIPEPNPLNPGGAWGTDDLPALLEGRDGAGVWFDCDGDNGYTQDEDCEARVALPSGLSGAWGFLDGLGRDLGQVPSDDTRGFWVDLDGNGAYDAGRDGAIRFDHWGLDG